MKGSYTPGASPVIEFLCMLQMRLACMRLSLTTRGHLKRSQAVPRISFSSRPLYIGSSARLLIRLKAQLFDTHQSAVRASLAAVLVQGSSDWPLSEFMRPQKVGSQLSWREYLDAGHKDAAAAASRWGDLINGNSQNVSAELGHNSDTIWTQA